MANRPESTPAGFRIVGIGLAVAIVVAIGAVIVTNLPSAGEADAGPGQTLRLQGSNTIGSELAPDLAQAFLAGKGATGVQQVVDDGLVTVSGTVPGDEEPTTIEIRSEGTETAFDGLEAGDTDIGMASRRITDAEAQQLVATTGDLLDRSSENVVGLDAVAVVVAPGNGVTALNMDQLRNVFTCQVTDWAEVGGTPGPIRVLARDANSGTFESFRDMVLGEEPLCPAAERIADSAELSGEVAQDPSAIGFIGLPFVMGNTALELFAGNSSPTGPDALSVSTESYLLTRRLYFYLPTLPAVNPLAAEFVTFSLTESAQSIVADDGFVSPLFPPPPPPQPPCEEGAPPQYCAAVGGAERIPFDVRFDSGTEELDNRAFRNLDLFADSPQAGAGQQVVLVGFADNAGTDQANQELSDSRAVAVRDYLEQQGVPATILPVGFGEALPVDTNDTPEGREQNRRVEVWVK